MLEEATAMPWPKGRKQKTRNRIVDTAAMAFRGKGIDGVSVADIMKRSGLTHGGFYAHFSSKDDLLAEAVAHAANQLTSALEASFEKNPSGDQLLAAASAYLSPGHLAHPDRGCPVAALGPELTRSNQKVRRALSAAIEQRLDQFCGLVTTRIPPEARRRQATGVLACMLGGLILARGLPESEALNFLKDCQTFLRDAVADRVATVARLADLGTAVEERSGLEKGSKE